MGKEPADQQGGGFINSLVDELVSSVDKTIINDDEKGSTTTKGEEGTENAEGNDDGIITELYKYPQLEGLKAFMLTMWVPKEFVGRIIGRKGDVVSKLSRETHTNIYCDSTSTSKSLWTTVCMVGDAYACQRAYQKIRTICDDEVGK